MEILAIVGAVDEGDDDHVGENDELRDPGSSDERWLARLDGGPEGLCPSIRGVRLDLTTF